MTRILFSFITLFLSYGMFFAQEKINSKSSIKSINNISFREKFKSDFLISARHKKEKSLPEIEQLDSATYYLHDTITSELKQGERYLIDFKGRVAVYYTWDSMEKVWRIKYKDVIVYDDFDSSYFQTYLYLESGQQYILSGKEYRKLNGGINYFESYAINKIGLWVGVEKSEKKEDSTGFLLLNANYDWDSISKIWVGNNKIEYKYDSLGHAIFEQIYTWNNIIKTWVYNTKNEYLYDKFNNLNLKANYSWNSGLNEWEGVQKYEAKFDVNFNELSYLIYSWDSSSKNWDSLSRTQSVFDLNNKLTLRVKSNWDSNSNSFNVYQRDELIYNVDLDLIFEYQTDISSSISYSKKEFSYLSQGKMNEITYLTSLDSVNWNFIKKDTIEYDLNQNLLFQISLNWNSLNSTWENIPKTNDVRIDYGLIQNGEQTIITSSYNGNSFDSILKKINYYDNLLNLISEENYIKNGNTWSGISNGKTDYYYDNGVKYTFASYNWDSNLASWIGDWKSIHIIDKALNGLSSEFIEIYSWDSVKKEWFGTDKTQYNYDTNDKPTLIYSFVWNEITKKWNNSQKIEYINSLNFDDYIKYVWSNTQYVWVKSLKSAYFENDSIRKTTLSFWANSKSEWSDFSFDTEYLHLENTSSGLVEVSLQKANLLYPNPSTGSITIENIQVGDYFIVNVLGQNVYSFSISNSNSSTVNVDFLEKGMYFIVSKNYTLKQDSIQFILD